ncbi:MAG TPA: hypothetical protein VN023_04145 [Methylovorus sp.]|nr:hypothetical protein [Methylovorus sp.]
MINAPLALFVLLALALALFIGPIPNHTIFLYLSSVNDNDREEYMFDPEDGYTKPIMLLDA